jgi:RNA-directed DNA polymerase
VIAVSLDPLRLLDESRTRFDFLGFVFRRVPAKSGRWWALRQPRPEKRTALLAKLKAIFRAHVSRPIREVIDKINPILRGWVNYFAFGNASRCFSYVRTWVERKLRRLLARARGSKGFGWKKWSRRWLVEELGLFDDYHVKPKASPAR